MRIKQEALAALGTIVVFCGFWVGAGAQDVAPSPSRIDGPVHRASIDLATGEVVRGDDSKRSVSCVEIWSNTDWSGYYSFPGPSGMWLDRGRIWPTGGSAIVCAYEFAYATTVLDTLATGPGASLCSYFYDDIRGWCGDSGLGMQPSATFCYTGLPGSPDGITPWAWIITADLTGGSEFVQDEGSFGYAMSFFDSSTRPPLVRVCPASSFVPAWKTTASSSLSAAFRPEMTCPFS